MFPELIIHNTISLDGSLSGFSADIGLHYQILGSLGPDAMLVGSNTAKTGADIFIGNIPSEEPFDLVKPAYKADSAMPYWIIADSRGILEGMLHVFRRLEYCQDVIVLISERTPASYVEYLQKRDYDHIVTGKEHANYRQALEICNQIYGLRKIATDCGSTLCGILLDQGLASMISLVVTPAIAGKENACLFGKTVKADVTLELVRQDVFDSGHLHVLYRVIQG
jgi:2,5-diamino-6-(ribosylamino)-4(3H)-pyrimidinone 5'-phosphate reductase